MTIHIAHATQKSPTHGINEDMVDQIDETTMILADGMGGEKEPAKASKIAVETAKKTLSVNNFSEISLETIKKILRESIYAADMELKKQVPGGGSTLSIAHIFLQNEKAFLIYANVGDSRISIMRGDRLLILTEDQNLLRAVFEDSSYTLLQKYHLHSLNLARYEEIRRKLNEVEDITLLDKDERFYFENRHFLFSGVGLPNELIIDTGIVLLEKNDRIILTSDGIHDNLTSAQIIALMNKVKDEKIITQAQKLVSLASNDLNNIFENRLKLDDYTTAIILIQ
jgi:protein phosphatase